MISTEAWVLYKGPPTPVPGELRKETITFPDLEDDELLVEPIYGCWEANTSHAIGRLPVDVCRTRREDRVVLGNAGVVRVARVGANVRSFREGDQCVFVANGKCDKFGNTITVFGYDAAGSVGLLARQTKVREAQLVPIPTGTKHTLEQWAAFSLKYLAAWANWEVAIGALRLQMSEAVLPCPNVWSWGGGVGFAELGLAKRFGCRVAMIASTDERLSMLRHLGIDAIDRREFAQLWYDKEAYESDYKVRRDYLQSERRFLDVVRARTGEEGISIFIDNIGAPVFRATLRALSGQGVVATCGWKHGMDLSFRRAVSCIARHTFVHTHGIRHTQARAATEYAERTGWLPPRDETIFDWDDIPELVRRYDGGEISSYFPLYRVNAP